MIYVQCYISTVLMESLIIQKIKREQPRSRHDVHLI